MDVQVAQQATPMIVENRKRMVRSLPLMLMILEESLRRCPSAATIDAVKLGALYRGKCVRSVEK
jgi:hydroxymethylpyrimidine/phosphomethylpyrimidine kinase